MPSFGDRSKNNLDTCHPDLQRLLNEAINHVDFSVIEGFRTTERQQQYFAEGKSTLDGVKHKSKHQQLPSYAVDILPYPANLHGVNIWQDIPRFALFIGTIKGIALQLGINIRCGCDWNGDGSTKDHRFVDFPHIELM